MFMLRTLACGILALAAYCAHPACAETADASALGNKVGDFELADIYGVKHRLSEYAARPAVVLLDEPFSSLDAAGATTARPMSERTPVSKTCHPTPATHRNVPTSTRPIAPPTARAPT